MYPYCNGRICFRVFCVLQMSGLKPIGSNMLKLILEYSKLAAALDTTRHHMSVNGVFLPDNHGMNSD